VIVSINILETGLKIPTVPAVGRSIKAICATIIVHRKKEIHDRKLLLVVLLKVHEKSTTE